MKQECVRPILVPLSEVGIVDATTKDQVGIKDNLVAVSGPLTATRFHGRTCVTGRKPIRDTLGLGRKRG